MLNWATPNVQHSSIQTSQLAQLNLRLALLSPSLYFCISLLQFLNLYGYNYGLHSLGMKDNILPMQLLYGEWWVCQQSHPSYSFASARSESERQGSGKLGPLGPPVSDKHILVGQIEIYMNEWLDKICKDQTFFCPSVGNIRLNEHLIFIKG